MRGGEEGEGMERQEKEAKEKDAKDRAVSHLTCVLLLLGCVVCLSQYRLEYSGWRYTRCMGKADFIVVYGRRLFPCILYVVPPGMWSLHFLVQDKPQ